LRSLWGWKLGHPEILELRWSDEWFEGTQRITTKGFLHFDTSWEWLMPVVEKIESLGYSVEIVKHICRIALDEHTSIVISENIPKIEAIYQAAVQFIEWYNEQKN